MSKRLKRKAALAFLIEILCIAILGIFLTLMQTRISVNTQKKDTKVKIEQMQELIDNADETALQNTVSYDQVYQSKAGTVAYMAAKNENFQYAQSNLKDLASRMNVTNILILDREGNQIAAAESSAADFTYNRYNQLRTVFESGEPSEAFEVTVGEEARRYYGARIDDNREAVIEHDPQELTELLHNTSSWESILSKVSVGLEGFTFAVSSQDYTFLYHPDEKLVKTDALTAGIDVTELEDNYYGWITINEERFYCGVTNIDKDNAYIICAVPEKEITASRNITVGVVLFIFFVIITIVVIYAVLICKEQERDKEANPKDYTKKGGLYFNKVIGRKAGAISAVGLILIFIVSFYMQTLFSISLHSMNNNQRSVEVEDTIERNAKDIEKITEQYNRRYLNKCQMASYILGLDRTLWTREDLDELSRVLDVEFILIFDENGKVVTTNSTYTNFQLSDDPEDQSYEFNKLLQGVEHVIQEAKPDEISGEYHQYIGSILNDQEGNPNGFVQISVTPERLKESLAATELSTVLNRIRVGTDGFAFAIDKDSKKFSCFPNERRLGKKATEYGIEKDQLRDGYSDYITIAKNRYYATCLETNTDYIYVAVPDNEMTGSRIPVALASTGVSLICLLLVLIVLAANRKREKKEEEETETLEGPMFTAAGPDGRGRKTEDAASRWANISMKWDDKTAEQQIMSVLRILFSVFALVICVSVLFKDTFFDSSSIFLYVINGGWEQGVNVFAITGCIMIICVVSVIIMLLRKILKLMSRTFGAKGETICRLLSSFAKYASVLIMLYYCLALFGVNTRTLLASAGILTLVVGLGAQQLVSDILAGLFIIFEGEFQVGDIVTIGDWRGTVLEIGVRTTKIEDAGNNVKVVSNSEVSGVINMTRRHSFAWCDVGIEYGESLERVENILAKELPNIKKRVPSIVDGPFYKGVVSLGDNSVDIRIVAQCAEADRIQLGRDLNREMKIVFDKYDINIPFPQVVVNEPKEYLKATEWEKRRADEFNKSQKELAKGLEGDDDDTK